MDQSPREGIAFPFFCKGERGVSHDMILQGATIVPRLAADGRWKFWLEMKFRSQLL